MFYAELFDDLTLAGGGAEALGVTGAGAALGVTGAAAGLWPDTKSLNFLLSCVASSLYSFLSCLSLFVDFM